MDKGFSLIELTVSVAVLAILTAGVYSFLSMGSKTYNMEIGYIQMQQEMRRAMDSLTKDLRGAKATSFSDTAAYPNNITFSALNGTIIRYDVDGSKNQLWRNATSHTVAGNYITDVTFVKSSKLLSVNISVEKPINVFTGIRNVTASLEEKVRLRND